MRRPEQAEGERGSATAFMVVFLAAFVALGGLVIDGGYVLAGRRVAINEAQSAARAGAGALAVDSYRNEGAFVVDVSRAEQAAHAYLEATGHPGVVRVDGDTVEVTVEFRQPLVLLGLVGLRDVEVRGVGRARQARGVVEEVG